MEESVDGRMQGLHRVHEAAKDLYGSFLFAFVVGIVLIAALVYYADPWVVLANTRLLDLLVEGGIIPLTDADAGYGTGLPDVTLYIASQDGVDWVLLLITLAMFGLLTIVKALQFHRIARYVGIDGKFGRHGRAYIYGHGVNRMLPHDIGAVAAASALEGQGASLEQATKVVYLGRLFLVFEIVIFAAVGLYYVSLGDWLTQLLWPAIILASAYLLMRGARAAGTGRRERLRAGMQSWGVTLRGALDSFRVLARSPLMLVELAVLSIASFMIIDAAAYFIPQAFTGDFVFLDATGPQILMALVGGYIARLIPVTPGGIGQFEWGFAAVLYVAGVGFPDAATIAILVSVVRYFAGAIIFFGIMLTYGIETDIRHVFQRFKGEAVEPIEPIEPIEPQPAEAV